MTDPATDGWRAAMEHSTSAQLRRAHEEIQRLSEEIARLRRQLAVRGHTYHLTDKGMAALEDRHG